MNLLFLPLLIGELIEPNNPPKSAGASSQMPARTGASGPEVIVFADGCADLAGEVVERLRRTLAPQEAIRVTRFDPQPSGRRDTFVGGENRDLLTLQPEAAAYELLSSVERPDVPVHSIHLTCSVREGGFLRRIGRAVAGAALWLIAALIDEDQQLDTGDHTGRILKQISRDTGGEICVASDRPAALRCADAIAARISGAAVKQRGVPGTPPRGAKERHSAEP